MRLPHVVRAYPTLLRVGLAGMFAYRAEFLVWVLTTNMPFVQMGLWTAVAATGPVGRFGQREFAAYYLAMFLVRILTGSWMVWELTMDIRGGVLATRLLRPLHPLWGYSAEHLAAVPLRLLVVSPVFVALWWVVGDRLLAGPLWRFPLLLASFAGAWLILFFTMALVGTLALYIDSALSVFELWLGVHAVLSGYLVPLELMPGWVAQAARVLPFRYMLGFPVETLIGLEGPAEALRDLGIQWLYVVVLGAAALAAWRAGMKKFVAFGG